MSRSITVGTATAAGRRGASLPELRRVGRFLVVGAGGTVLDFGLLAVLLVGGVPTLVANSLAFSAGAVSNYTWNRLWTFADTGRRPWLPQAVRFFAVSLGGLAINDLVVLGLQVPLGGLVGRPGLGYVPAKVVATAVAVGWNYAVNRYWTFGGPGRRGLQEVE